MVIPIDVGGCLMLSILGIFPVGEAKLDTKTKVDAETLPFQYAIYKVTVLPPRKQIFHPVLPQRYDGKVMERWFLVKQQ